MNKDLEKQLVRDDPKPSADKTNTVLIPGTTQNLGATFGKQVLREFGWLLTGACGLVVALALDRAVMSTFLNKIPPGKTKRWERANWIYFTIVLISSMIIITCLALLVATYTGLTVH